MIASGTLDKAVTADTACVLIQSPNFFGTIEDVWPVSFHLLRGRLAKSALDFTIPAGASLRECYALTARHKPQGGEA